MDNFNHIEKRRKFVGMTIKEACERLDITAPTYRAWRKNPTLPRINRVKDVIAKYCEDNKL